MTNKEILVKMSDVMGVFDDMIQYAEGPKERAFVTNIRETVFALDAALAAEKPTADEGLVGELSDLTWSNIDKKEEYWKEKVRAIYRKYRPVPSLPVEPLAVLADRKGCSIEYTGPAFYADQGNPWEVNVVLPTIGDCHSFEAPTYAACEAKARAYLEGLNDKENEK